MNYNTDSLYQTKRAVQRKLYECRIAEARQQRHQFVPVEAMAEKLNVRKTKLIAYCIVNGILLTNGRGSGINGIVLSNDRRSGITVDKTALDRALKDPDKSFSDFELPEERMIRALNERELSETDRQKLFILNDCNVEIR